MTGQIAERSAAEPPPSGKLALNIMHFARALRAAGLPIGPGAVHVAIEAVELAGLTHREDVRVALHATLVSRHEHTILFEQAFAAFWRRRGYLEKLLAAMSPVRSRQAKTPANQRPARHGWPRR